MLQALIAHEQEIIQDLYSLCLEGSFDAEVNRVSSGQAAINYLGETDKVNLIIIDVNIKGGCESIIEEAMGLKFEPILILSATDQKSADIYEKKFPEIPILKEATNTEALIQKVTELLGTINKTKSLYHPVRINYFVDMEEATFDVFIKLSDEKFVKIVNKGDKNIKETFEKYKEKVWSTSFYILMNIKIL